MAVLVENKGGVSMNHGENDYQRSYHIFSTRLNQRHHKGREGIPQRHQKDSRGWKSGNLSIPSFSLFLDYLFICCFTWVDYPPLYMGVACAALYVHCTSSKHSRSPSTVPNKTLSYLLINPCPWPCNSEGPNSIAMDACVLSRPPAAGSESSDAKQSNTPRNQTMDLRSPIDENPNAIAMDVCIPDSGISLNVTGTTSIPSNGKKHTYPDKMFQVMMKLLTHSIENKLIESLEFKKSLKERERGLTKGRRI
ncbi:hypothetical protein F5146DRAFT_1004014 [Armillaria mellea]|nr:hypothetical protein F5146DRAFT_1004014 [Armillaria mellea]